MYRAFRSDPGYLTRYHMKSAGAMLCLVALAAYLSTYVRPLDLKTMAIFVPALFLLSSTYVVSVMSGFAYCAAAMVFVGWSWAALAWLPLSFVSALFITSILHNAAHDNVRPKWLRRPLGEVCGLIQLVGFADWVVLHVIHHSHPDDPERDPHPPLNLSYWNFLVGMRASILKVLLTEYFGLYGKNEASMKHIKKLALFSKGEQMLKIAFWYFVLGPSAFTFFFVSSIVFKMMHYAWFNWATHRPMENGHDTINLNMHFYKMVNAITFGLYYHRNHHINPKLFDPRKFREPGAGSAKATGSKTGSTSSDVEQVA